MKPTTSLKKSFQLPMDISFKLPRQERVALTRIRIIHTQPTHSHLMKKESPTDFLSVDRTINKN